VNAATCPFFFFSLSVLFRGRIGKKDFRNKLVAVAKRSPPPLFLPPPSSSFMSYSFGDSIERGGNSVLGLHQKCWQEAVPCDHDLAFFFSPLPPLALFAESEKGKKEEGSPVAMERSEWHPPACFPSLFPFPLSPFFLSRRIRRVRY